MYTNRTAAAACAPKRELTQHALSWLSYRARAAVEHLPSEFRELFTQIREKDLHYQGADLSARRTGHKHPAALSLLLPLLVTAY